MSKPRRKLVFEFARTIPAPPSDVFDAWLSSKIPGTPWNAAEQFVLDPRVGGLFFWRLRGTSHYGRFTRVRRPAVIRHTWVSPYTLGEESVVNVTFKKKGDGTLMSLVHSDLPDCGPAKGHKNGWSYFLDIFHTQFGRGSRRSYRWEDAHLTTGTPRKEKAHG